MKPRTNTRQFSQSSMLILGFVLIGAIGIFDFLTGYELSFSVFYIFTLAYIDLDNFKSTNDQFGHSIGDQILRTVVSSARSDLRKIDVIARLGGDEFALLLPETDQESARIVLSRLQGRLLEEMRQNHWSITFSIGVLTCDHGQSTAVELLKMADRLMYSVKHGGKNATKYFVYSG